MCISLARNLQVCIYYCHLCCCKHSTYAAHLGMQVCCGVALLSLKGRRRVPPHTVSSDGMLATAKLAADECTPDFATLSHAGRLSLFA